MQSQSGIRFWMKDLIKIYNALVLWFCKTSKFKRENDWKKLRAQKFWLWKNWVKEEETFPILWEWKELQQGW